MATKLRPCTPKAHALLAKLQALAERGIDGERVSAQEKISRLKARYDFGAQAAAPTLDASDLFFGVFKQARKARRIYTFSPDEFDVASSVKWAIESATKIPCIFRDGALLTEATAPTARRLEEITDHIARSFRALLAQFGTLHGLTKGDRAAFLMGLYDGMMNETRTAGQRLPSRAPPGKKRKGKKGQSADFAGLNIHPYTLAVGLGKQIRFSVPVEQIAAELDAVIQKHLADSQT